MSKSTLRLLAVLLTIGIVVVLFAGLDGLPREVRAQIGTERKALAAAHAQFSAAQDEVTRDLKSEPILFQAIPSSQQYSDRLAGAAGVLQSAAAKLDELGRIEKRNRRQDRQLAESLLSDERRLRTTALSDASAVQKDAAHWIDLKQHLPQEVREMERDYGVVHSFDLAALGDRCAEGRNRLARKKDRPRDASGGGPRPGQR